MELVMRYIPICSPRVFSSLRGGQRARRSAVGGAGGRVFFTAVSFSPCWKSDYFCDWAKILEEAASIGNQANSSRFCANPHIAIITAHTNFALAEEKNVWDRNTRIQTSTRPVCGLKMAENIRVSQVRSTGCRMLVSA